MIKNLISLTKPGIIFGNLITVIGGFFLASKGNVNVILLFYSLSGISLVIASGCVFNNYIDRDIDKIMERTRKRALVQGLISGKIAIIYAILLGISGISILFFQTNLLTVIIAVIGFLVYVVAYSLWLKRNSIYGTIIGSISGAVPPLIGYCAVTNKFDIGAAILFLILSLWQMPHSYAIGIYRLNDYKAASIPLLPVKQGIYITKVNMLIYIVAFVIATFSLTYFNYTGKIYCIVMAFSGLIWIYQSIMGFKSNNDQFWARKMFTFSIIIITLFSIMLIVNSFI